MDNSLPTLPVNDCCGCGTCVSICSHDAVTLEIDSKGFYYPIIDYTRCVKCQMCMEVCCYDGSIGDEKVLDRFDAFLAGSKNEDLRNRASSGGFISQLLIDLLESDKIDCAIVVGSVINSIHPKAIIARTKQEIIKAAGSKYCPVPVNNILSEIDWMGERVAYVGLPCHISRLKKYLDIKYKSKCVSPLIIGLFCNHTPSFMATNYLMYLHKIEETEVEGVSYREGEWPGFVEFCRQSGGQVKIPYMQAWASGFGFFFHNDACLNCTDFVSSEASINVADPWAIEKSISSGKSLIFVNRKQSEVIDDLCNISVVHLDNSQKKLINRKMSRSKGHFSTKAIKKIGGSKIQWPLISILSKIIAVKNRIFSVLKYYSNKYLEIK